MRTTITFEPDVAAAVEAARHERRVGISAAVNHLIRQGLSQPDRERKTFVQQTSPLGLRIDVANVAEALETLDGPAAP